MRPHVMPGARILCTVAMMFKPVRIDEKPRMNTPVPASSTLVCEYFELYGG